MKKVGENKRNKTMPQSTANIEIEIESANTSPATFYAKNSVTNPAEILMNLIFPTVANRLKYYQEIIKLKESNS